MTIDQAVITSRTSCDPRSEPSTPVVVMRLDVVEARYRELTAALSDVQVYYAVKANPDIAILGLLNDLGCRFDVAGRAEIDTCLAAGVEPEHMSFGHTIKRTGDIDYAHQLGVPLYAADSPDELDKVLSHAPGRAVVVRVATSGAGARWPLSAKFGCDEAQARALLARATSAGAPVGLAFHVGSQQTDPDAWAEAMQTVERLTDVVRRAGQHLTVLNLGGGLPGHYVEPMPELDSYARRIHDALGPLSGPGFPEVVIEPGRYLVADAGTLITEALLVADRADARWVYLDAGIYSGLVETAGEAIRFPVSTECDGDDAPLVPCYLAGPTCDSADILNPATPYWLPASLRTGDRVVLHSTGAYVAACTGAGFNGIPPLRQVCR